MDKPGARTRFTQLVVIVVLLGIGPVAALLASALTDFGSRVEHKLFEVAALVGPLLGLALFIDFAIVVGRILAPRGTRVGTAALAQVLVYSNVGLILVSEGFAFYAVGSNRRSTFLVVAVMVPLVEQLGLLASSAVLKIRAADGAAAEAS